MTEQKGTEGTKMNLEKRKTRTEANRGNEDVKPPKFIWADFDPGRIERYKSLDLPHPPSVRWKFYNTKAQQRFERPDLRPLKLRVVLVEPVPDFLPSRFIP